jgi:ubiquinone/menaquinone biosynthesis C-methylase UbiE
MTTLPPWSSPEVVARFATSPPNEELIRFATVEQGRGTGLRLLDIGCGAGCNAVPLSQMGWKVLGIDLSEPMLAALMRRAEAHRLGDRLEVKLAPMHELPVEDQSCDFIVAHGIWNLARSGMEFRQAVREATRAAKPGAPLFVYTFSSHTFPSHTRPLVGESFVYDKFSGSPQCFLTKTQLIEELCAAGFVQEPGWPIKEYSRSLTGTKPAINEGIFRKI